MPRRRRVGHDRRSRQLRELATAARRRRGGAARRAAGLVAAERRAASRRRSTTASRSAPGAALAGPAIVELANTTIVVLDGFELLGRPLRLVRARTPASAAASCASALVAERGGRGMTALRRRRRRRDRARRRREPARGPASRSRSTTSTRRPPRRRRAGAGRGASLGELARALGRASCSRCPTRRRSSTRSTAGLEAGLRRGLGRARHEHRLPGDAASSSARRLAPAASTCSTRPISGGPVKAARGRARDHGRRRRTRLRARPPAARGARLELVHVGPLGHGEIAKLVNNLMGAVIVVGDRRGARARGEGRRRRRSGVCEAIARRQRLELDPARVDPRDGLRGRLRAPLLARPDAQGHGPDRRRSRSRLERADAGARGRRGGVRARGRRRLRRRPTSA